MIKGLYETHIQVSDLENAINFYTKVLGLKFAYKDENRRIAFLWVGKDKEFMLGLWEQKEDLQTRHFAFTADKEDILNYSAEFLKNKDLTPYNFLKNPWSLPGCRLWPFILMIRTATSWSSSLFWKVKENRSWEFFLMKNGLIRLDKKDDSGFASQSRNL